MEPVTLVTSRLVLRAPTLDDVDAITAACQDAAIQRWVPVPVPYRREDAVAYVREHADGGWASGRCCTWAIRLGSACVGAVGLDRVAGGAAEIGFWIERSVRGRGLAVEAASRVLDFAFAAPPTGLGLQRVAWHAYAGNVASAAVAARIGFRFEGVLRQGVLGRQGREDDWVAGVLRCDPRHPQHWSEPPGTRTTAQECRQPD